jgi:hypothetical protein
VVLSQAVGFGQIKNPLLAPGTPVGPHGPWH